jgi:hypothetical protein
LNKGKFQNILGRFDLTLLYSAPWVKKCSLKKSARCDCFLFLAFVLRFGSAALFSVPFSNQYSLRMSKRYVPRCNPSLRVCCLLAIVLIYFRCMSIRQRAGPYLLRVTHNRPIVLIPDSSCETSSIESHTTRPLSPFSTFLTQKILYIQKRDERRLM